MHVLQHGNRLRPAAAVLHQVLLLRPPSSEAGVVAAGNQRMVELHLVRVRGQAEQTLRFQPAPRLDDVCEQAQHHRAQRLLHKRKLVGLGERAVAVHAFRQRLEAERVVQRNLKQRLRRDRGLDGGQGRLRKLPHFLPHRPAHPWHVSRQQALEHPQRQGPNRGWVQPQQEGVAKHERQQLSFRRLRHVRDPSEHLPPATARSHVGVARGLLQQLAVHFVHQIVFRGAVQHRHQRDPVAGFRGAFRAVAHVQLNVRKHLEGFGVQFFGHVLGHGRFDGLLGPAHAAALLGHHAQVLGHGVELRHRLECLAVLYYLPQARARRLRHLRQKASRHGPVVVLRKRAPVLRVRTLRPKHAAAAAANTNLKTDGQGPLPPNEQPRERQRLVLSLRRLRRRLGEQHCCCGR
mmetsp:Transcript_22579/g.44688  ORF Transcript_22579/g.44688 Transcript_22579/m.44688 type:complete len:405 (-) Transcript_22579:727-1941(-)